MLPPGSGSLEVEPSKLTAWPLCAGLGDIVKLAVGAWLDGELTVSWWEVSFVAPRLSVTRSLTVIDWAVA